MISNELSKPYTTRTRKTMDNFEKGYEEIFTKKKWYNVFNLSIIRNMIKQVNGKWYVYKGKKKLGRFGNKETAKIWEKIFVTKK